MWHPYVASPHGFACCSTNILNLAFISSHYINVSFVVITTIQISHQIQCRPLFPCAFTRLYQAKAKFVCINMSLTGTCRRSSIQHKQPHNVSIYLYVSFRFALSLIFHPFLLHGNARFPHNPWLYLIKSLKWFLVSLCFH